MRFLVSVCALTLFASQGLASAQAVHVVRAAVPPMRDAGRGAIVNMSSISYMMATFGYAPYIASNAAITGLTRTLARIRELAKSCQRGGRPASEDPLAEHRPLEVVCPEQAWASSSARSRSTPVGATTLV